MNIRSPFCRWVACTVLCGIAAAAVAGEAGVRKNPGPSEDPAPLTVWVLVGRPKFKKGLPGIQLYANAAGEVDQLDNLLTGAEGKIANRHIPDPPDRRYGCHCTHFHGSLQDVPGNRHRDPDPNHCGWGCVVLYESASDAVADLSDAVMAEHRAYNKALNHDVEGALEELTNALASLDQAIEEAPEVGDGGWTQRDANEFQRDLEDAQTIDAKASATLRSALNTPVGSKRRRTKELKAAFQIADALKEKGRAMVRLGRWEIGRL